MSESGSSSSVGTATVMFTDLVGSTATRSRVGEDVADMLRATHDDVVGTAVAAHGGRVVKHLGDGMMATFGSAAGAVAAAVAMQQELDLWNRRSPAERMEIRIGISTGDVTFEDDDCFGLPVVEAQRLEASAEPATIRCAEMVMLMARGRGGHEFVPIGELDLKGLAEPLAACEVRWTPVAEPDSVEIELGLPPVFAHGTGLPFAGRDEVFDQLVDAWKRCAAGGFEVVLLAGEPGIGKTRLAQELATRVHGGDGVVLGGRSDEDVAVPFQAFGAALDWFVRQVDAGDRLDALGEYPGDLVRLVPELGRLVDGLPAALDDDPDVERHRLFQAVASWLSVGGDDRPRLLVLDDLHWADKPSLLLLRHLIVNPPAGLMILCTYRDTDVDRTHPLSSMLADFRRMPAVSRIALDGLGDDGVRDLLIRTGGHDLDEIGLAFAERVQRETSGNPFFLGEVLRHLTETGALYERDGRWVSDLSPDDAGIPEGIREVVGRRLSRLGDDVEGVLRSAAVIGYEFDVDLLADVVGRDADDVLDALDTAAAANLVIEIGVDRHRFAHALVRETLHAELSSSRRARQHRKVAEALEALHRDDIDAVVTELATHWAEASAGGDPTRAIELAVRAGELAEDRAAVENAARWFEQALDLLDDEQLATPRARRVAVMLAEVQSRGADGAAGRVNALTAAKAAIEVGDVDPACHALEVMTRGSFSADDPADPERVELLRRALDLAGLSASQRASLLGELAVELIFERDIPGRRRALDEQMALLATLPVEERGWLMRSPGNFRYAHFGHAEMRDQATWVESLPEHRLSPSARLTSYSVLFYLHLRLHDGAGMERDLRRAIAAGDQPTRAGAFATIIRSTSALLVGRLDDAERLAAEGVARLSAMEVPEALNYLTTTTLANARERGSIGELGGLADAAAARGHHAGAAAAIAAYIRFVQGRTDEVLEALDRLDGEELSDDAGHSVVIAYWSEIVAALGDVDRCRRFIGEIEPLTGIHVGTGGICLGAADRLLALLYDAVGQPARADEFFARAVAQHAGIRSPTWVARTELDWADSLLARDRADDARLHADAAATVIGDLDLPDSQRRLDDLAARLAIS
jgi:class 3 adenylate cyclase/tetratricopeptide (TPR) repeat protein